MKKIALICILLLSLVLLFSACDENKPSTPEIPTAEHTHTLGDWVTDKAATCTEDGQRHQICSTCGETIKTEKIPATGHTEVIDAAVAPTCTAAGSRHKTCTDCGDTVIEELPATGHSFGEWQAVTSQSCTSGGIEVRTCATCGAYEQRNSPAPGHQFGEWSITKAVTCTGNGERTRTCSVCGVLQRETIWSQGHQYGDWVTVKPATCEKGLQERTCSVCGKVDKNYLPADYTLHIWGEDACTVCGEHKASEGLQYELLSNNQIAICGYTGSDTTVYLPSSFYGSVVTTIKAEAFKNQTQITEIVIPESITNIDSTAFSGCTNIQKATMPTWAISAVPKNKLQTVIFNGGTSIEYRSFYGCTSLTSVTISDSVTSIGQEAFSRCTSLTSITIPDSVTSIEEGAFGDCTSLKNVYITDIAKWCAISFANPLYFAHNLYLNGELVTDLVIPEGVTNIGDSAFYWCTSLTNVTIPNSVTSIGSAAFYGCCRLVEIHNLSALSITAGNSDNGYVGYYAKHVFNDGESYLHTTDDGFVFYDDGVNVSLIRYSGAETALILPETYNGKPYAINQYALHNCTVLTSVTLPDSVTSIEKSAFENCTSLTSITIPNSVTNIGNSAFSGCSALKSATISDSVTSIGGAAFSYCTSLTSITIPDSVTSIGYSTFYNCTVLTSVTLPDSVTSIGGAAFSYCTSLTSITIPNGIIRIEVSTFEKCTSLTSATIPNSVTSIGGHAFRNCPSLTQIVFLGTVEEWNAIEKEGYWSYGTNHYNVAFYNDDLEFTSNGDGTCSISGIGNCTAFALVIPAVSPDGDIVTSIGDFVFDCYESLESVTIPDSVTSIGIGVFSHCTSLTSITVAEENPIYHSAGNCIIETASKTLIAGCKNSVIPDDGSVTRIEDGAFSGCTKLTSVTIPDSVTSIGGDAFCDCTSLTSITIPNRETYSWGITKTNQNQINTSEMTASSF